MTDASGIAADRLKSLIERVERLEEEKAAIANDIKEIYAEARAAGFDVKIMRQVVRIRKQDAKQVAEEEQLRDVYMNALGDLKDTGLGNAAMARDGVRAKPVEGDVAREDLKSSVDNLTREPGAAISVTTGGITTTLKNVDGKRVLEQTGEPPHDMGPPPRDPSVNSAIDFLKRDMNRAAAQ